jgi:hypothetical protein
MVIIGRTYVDDVDVGVIEEVVGFGGQFFHAILRAPGLERALDYVAARDDFGVGVVQPSGHMGVGDAADADHADL